MTVTITPYIKVTTPTETITQNVKSCGRMSCEPRIISHGDNFCPLCGTKLVEKTAKKTVKVNVAKLLKDNKIELDSNEVDLIETGDSFYIIPHSVKSTWKDLSVIDLPSNRVVNESINKLKQDQSELIKALEKAVGLDDVLVDFGIINR